MGNKQGKVELTGPAKEMLGKHGEVALKGLRYWNTLGFPKMGCLSLKNLKELEQRLLQAEKRHKRVESFWYAFHLWATEGQDRIKNKPGKESVESVGIFNLNVSREIDMDLDCPPAAHLNQPPPPPSYDHTPPKLYPDLPADEDAPGSSSGGGARAVTRSQTTTQRSLQQQGTAPARRGPAAVRPMTGGKYSLCPQNKDEEDGLFPMIEVLNPQDGRPAYVFRAWRPSDIKDMAECLPDPAVAGGAGLATALLEMTQQHKASAGEVRQVCVARLGLRWGRIQGNFPGRDEADVMFNWDQGSVYRLHVERLCERAREAFPLVRDWTAIREVKQRDGEKVSDLMDRVEKIFRVHGGMPVPTDRVAQSPYEENLTAAFLDALSDEISGFIQTHCIGWRTARLALIVSHATHAENLMNKKERQTAKDDKKVEKKLHLAQLEALENPRPSKSEKGKPRGKQQARFGSREKQKHKNRRECFRCGHFGHWHQECPERGQETGPRRDNGAGGWQSAPPSGVTVQYPRGGGGGGGGGGGR